mgnify:FL=1
MIVHCFVHGGRESNILSNLDSFRLYIFFILFTECFPCLQGSLEECARYLETIKIYENKPADVIQERIDHDYLSRVMDYWSYQNNCKHATYTYLDS